MTIITESILMESKAARSNQLKQIEEERVREILSKIKYLYFAVWQGKESITTDRVAQFYEVPETNLRKLLKTHREEFISDGLKTIRGKDLKDARDLWSLPLKTSQATIWTPRAVLRLGMLMRDSLVALAVRTSLLNALEKTIPAQAIEIEKLKLQLQVAQAQERLLAQSRVLALVDPGLPAIVLGNPNAVVTRTEVIERTVLINEQGRSRVSYEGLSKTKLAKKYGMKRAKDLVDWLKSIGKEDVLKPGLIATSCQYIPIEEIAELDRLWAAHRGLRQILIGE
ncbi:conserved hypothetical protein [Hyella patelloides LEGE 07179]|uniref:Uncharacterized protein n=1 Tax=Hyella patelloides LEGE 07179 TaxID=945734 RepID=A0A563VXY7_9CYAN|nr:hypothetical protein [Hyella patelloides]VEP16318.1 conserved hypothetical protein [Hyella patelloides LEGE 07179]